MKQTAKWILGLGMLAFCLQLKPCPHGNCPAGQCLEEGPRPMGWQLISEEDQQPSLSPDRLLLSFPDSLSQTYQKED